MKNKVVRDLDLLWIFQGDKWICYDFDEDGNRILVGTYREDELISEEKAGIRPKSRFKGVNLHTQAYKAGRKKKWQASFIYEKRKHHFGTFETDTEAAIAYDEGVKMMNLTELKGLNFN